MKKVTTVFLLLSGITGVYIGASLLFNPIAFEASAAIPIDANVNLLSEIRSSGGLIFATGILIALGGILKKAAKHSLMLSVLFYLAYGISRTIALAIDGIPGTALVSVTIAELVIGSVSLALLLVHMHHEKTNTSFN